MQAGSSIIMDNTGAKVSEMRYKPWGEVRYTWTSALATTPTYMLSNYTFTGQYSYMDDLSTPATEGFGLMFYNARFYDPALGRFTSADTIVPGGVQGLDRYAYVNNSPINYVDPSGHCSVEQGMFDGTLDCTAGQINKATIKQRLGWFRGLTAETGLPEWFTNIEGILQAFIDEGLGDTNSWMSWVDAGILESIQNGYALFKADAKSDGSSDDPNEAWLEFFLATTDSERKKEWGEAENAGTQYGLSLADEHEAEMSGREELFLWTGNNLYRNLLASGQIEEFYGALGANVGALACPINSLICAGGGYVAGYGFGGWFGDPRNTDPVFNRAPVYYLAVLILEPGK